MSSSISTFKPIGWAYALRLYAAASVAALLAVSLLLIGLDPYDTGRMGLVEGYGVPATLGQRLTVASTARAPAAEAAIIGNSTIQLLDPARFSAMTSIRSVSLAIPGSGPREQLAVARWFLSHHLARGNGPPRAVVFGLDRTWCEGDGRLELAHPFPFWLYSSSGLDYALGMLQMQTVEAAIRKIKLMLGRERALPADGYHNYEADGVWDKASAERAFARDNGGIAASDPPDFAAVPLLRDFLSELPAQTSVTLLFPPRYISSLPAGGSAAARVEERCKAAYRELAADRPGLKLLDFATDGELARNELNFWDPIHYRGTVARQIEDAIAAAL